MGIFDGNPNSDNKPYVPAPAGMHPARLVSIVDLGHQESTWDGETKVARTFHLAWELVGTDSGDGKPFIVSKSYKATDGVYGVYFAKTSGAFKMLKQWLNWDDKKCSKVNALPTAMGHAAFINVAHKPSADGSKVWANVAGVMPAMAGMPVGEAKTDPLIWSVEGGDLNDLPGFLRKKAEESYQLQGKEIPKRQQKSENAEAALDEDIPS